MYHSFWNSQLFSTKFDKNEMMFVAAEVDIFVAVKWAPDLSPI